MMQFILEALFISVLPHIANGKAVGDAPRPAQITTPAKLRARADISTLGWFSASVIAGQTTYAPWTFDADVNTYTSSGNYIRRCPKTSSCTMYTSCSSGYMMGATTSAYCGVGAATGTATDYCSSHLVLPSLGAATGTQTWMWCDSDLKGMIFYAKEPSQPPRPTSSYNTMTSGAITSSQSQSTSASNSPTPIGEPGSNQVPVGVIAGAVAGGVAVIGVIVGIIFWVKRRDKRKKASAGRYSGYQGVALQQTPHTSDFTSSYRDNESKPVAIVQSKPQGPYGQGVYDSYPGQPTDIQRPQEMSGVGVARPPVEMSTEIPEHARRT